MAACTSASAAWILMDSSLAEMVPPSDSAFSCFAASVASQPRRKGQRPPPPRPGLSSPPPPPRWVCADADAGATRAWEGATSQGVASAMRTTTQPVPATHGDLARASRRTPHALARVAQAPAAAGAGKAGGESLHGAMFAADVTAWGRSAPPCRRRQRRERRPRGSGRPASKKHCTSGGERERLLRPAPAQGGVSADGPTLWSAHLRKLRGGCPGRCERTPKLTRF